jgi:hypothetical protein
MYAFFSAIALKYSAFFAPSSTISQIFPVNLPSIFPIHWHEHNQSPILLQVFTKEGKPS